MEYNSLVYEVIADIGPDISPHEDVPVEGEALLVHEVAPVGVDVPVAVSPGLFILNFRTKGCKKLNLKVDKIVLNFKGK